MNMLWDGAGYDTIDGSALAHDLVLDLRPGYWGHIGAKSELISAAGQVTIDFGTVIEAALGGSGNDSLTGNEAANRLTGGAGDDTLVGGTGSEGRDSLSGVERLHFADTSVALDVEGMIGQEFASLYGANADNATFLTKLYANVLHRAYDEGGFQFWSKALENGYSRADLLIDFADSPENVANVAALIANGVAYTPFA